MASKLAAAKIAAWSGVRAVIAAADRPGVLADAVAGDAGVGTVVRPTTGGCRPASSGSPSPSARRGTVVVDDGARRALVERGDVAAAGGRASTVQGRFDAEDAVEIAGPDGKVFAKGLVRRRRAAALEAVAGRRTADLPERHPPRGRPPRRPGGPALS